MKNKTLFSVFIIGFLFILPVSAQTFTTQYISIPVDYLNTVDLSESEITALNPTTVKKISYTNNVLIPGEEFVLGVLAGDNLDDLLGVIMSDTFTIDITDSGSNTYSLDATVNPIDLDSTKVLITVTEALSSGAEIGLAMVDFQLNSSSIGTSEVIIAMLKAGEPGFPVNAETTPSVDELIDIQKIGGAATDMVQFYVLGENLYDKTTPSLGQPFPLLDLSDIQIFPADGIKRLKVRQFENAEVVEVKTNVLKTVTGDRILRVNTPFGVINTTYTFPSSCTTLCSGN